jgi:single-stranded-DNA-specific exonuclease
MHFKWNYQPLTTEQIKAADNLSTTMGLNPILTRILVRRGIATEHDARQFFRPQLNQLHDPFLMNDMDVAVNRLNEAMGRKERIMVYGDYDVDGCTAVALVYKFLLQFYSNIEYYIPSRYEEGYGISAKGLEYAKETEVKLIIILDCGIKSEKEIAYAKEQGIDFIICDHHVPGDELPPAVAVLDPKRKDNTYPDLNLSGCGVGFKLVQGFAKSNGIPFTRLIPLLDLCAISIASDLVPVIGENRILAYHGLRQLNKTPSTGIKAIIEVCGLSEREISMSDIVFKLGPRINASGRMQNGTETVDLLVEKDYAQALRIANHVNEYNDQRRDIDKQMTEEANEIVSRLESQQHMSSIVLYDENWKKGVVGIVASRLTEIYTRPSIVLTRSEDMATGSARSVVGFNIYKAIESCKDLLESFGGHTYAVGLTMKKDNVPEFRSRFSKYVEEHILPEQTEASLDIDSIIDFGDISSKLRNELKHFAPYGPENPKPMFCTKHVYDYGTSKVVGREQEHIKLELVDSRSSNVMNGIAFGQSSQARYIKTRHSFDIVYTIEENAYKHGETQLQIEDIRPSE